MAWATTITAFESLTGLFVKPRGRSALFNELLGRKRAAKQVLLIIEIYQN